MNLHDRLRAELHERSATIPVAGTGPEAVIDAARARLRRSRVLGAAAAAVLVLGVTGVALSVRDDGDQVTTESATAPAAGTEEAVLEAPEPAPAADETDPVPGTSEDLANTDTEADEPAIADDAPDPAPTPEAEGEADGESEGDADTPGVSAPAALDLVAHNGGFVAQRSGSTLAYSADGVSWSSIASPRPGEHITDIVSYNGVLYAAGVSSQGGIRGAWAASSADLASWNDIDVPQPPDDGSSLTTVANTVTSLAVGPAGLIVTGETVVDINIDEILSADVFESDNWTLGDSSGDVSKIVVYDPDSGDPVEEIDLADLGIPTTTLELWTATSPTPFVATGEGVLVAVDTDLENGTVLRSTVNASGEYLAAGFSSAYSGQIVWSSTDGASWDALPVSVVAGSGADVIGRLGDRVVVFSGQGPLFTLQIRRGGEWREVRLDEDLGGRNATYRLLDAAFSGSGVAAAVSVTDEAGNVSISLVTSSDGAAWTVSDLAEVADAGGAVTGVDSLAVSAGMVGISYQRADGGHETALVALSLLG